MGPMLPRSASFVSFCSAEAYTSCFATTMRHWRTPALKRSAAGACCNARDNGPSAGQATRQPSRPAAAEASPVSRTTPPRRDPVVCAARGMFFSSARAWDEPRPVAIARARYSGSAPDSRCCGAVAESVALMAESADCAPPVSCAATTPDRVQPDCLAASSWSPRSRRHATADGRREWLACCISSSHTPAVPVVLHCPAAGTRAGSGSRTTASHHTGGP